LKFFGRRTPVEGDDLLATADRRLSHGGLADLSEPLIGLDLSGKIVDANAAARALEGFPPTPLDGSAGIEQVLARLRLTNGGGSPAWVPVPGDGAFDALVSVPDLPADERIYRIESTMSEDSYGRTTGWIVRLGDVTGLIEALRAERAAAGHRDRLLKLMSHDLRSPLAAILATLRHPDLAIMPEDPRRVIETAALRTLHMIDSNVRSIRAECADYVFVPLDLSYIVEEVVDASWSAGKAAGVKLVLEPASEDISIMADRGYLTEAVTDLLKYLIDTGGPGRIILCAFHPSTLGDKAAVTFVAKDVVDEGWNRGRPITNNGGAAPSPGAAEATDIESRLVFSRTVMKRHSATATLEGEPGVGRTASITIPLIEPV
jgi:hypothetical protein